MKNFGKIFGVLALILVVGFVGFGLLKSETPSISFGAASGPDQIGSDHYSQNGIIVYPNYVRMNTASTTLCSIKSPSATTTVKTFVANFTTATGTSKTVYLAKGLTSQATTTNFETAVVGANTFATIIASTTGRTNGLPVIPPSSYLVVGSSIVNNTANPLGYCTAEFQGV